MKKNIAVLVAACSACMAFADPNDPQAMVVSVKQGFDSGRTVKIDYTLDEPAIVTFDVKTNGVSIGAENLKFAYGDVHKVVEAGTRTLHWPAREAWPDHTSRKDGKFSVTVTAWATNSPPDYMVIKLVGDDKGARTFYTAPEQLPGVGGVTNDMYKTDYLVMRRIPAAGKTFRMGCPTTEAGRYGSETLHYVSLTNDYYMAVFELTAGQFRNITRNFSAFESELSAYNSIKLCYYQSQPNETPNLPIDYLNCAGLRGTEKLWPGDGHDVDATAPLALLREALGLPTLDLPTDAEWEFACRAGTLTGRYDGTEYVAGSDDVSSIAWIETNGSYSSAPHAVGLLKPNGYGLYDMYGNVAEWCLDRFNWAGAIAGSTVIAPVGPAVSDTGTERVVRGEFINNGGATSNVRSGVRKGRSYDTASNIWYGLYGFRLICTF